jgi:hypothetical protein
MHMVDVNRIRGVLYHRCINDTMRCFLPSRCGRNRKFKTHNALGPYIAVMQAYCRELESELRFIVNDEPIALVYSPSNISGTL